MKGNTLRLLVGASALCVILLLVPGLRAQDEAPAKDSQIAGQVVGLDGVTPLAERTVRILDAQGAVVGTATSAKDGTFNLPTLAPGSYTLEAGLLRQEFTLQKGQPLEKLTVLAPNKSEAIPLGKLRPTQDGGLSSTTVLLIAGGSAVVVGGVAGGIAIADGNNNDDEPTLTTTGVSGSTP